MTRWYLFWPKFSSGREELSCFFYQIENESIHDISSSWLFLAEIPRERSTVHTFARRKNWHREPINRAKISMANYRRKIWGGIQSVARFEGHKTKRQPADKQTLRLVCMQSTSAEYSKCNSYFYSCDNEDLFFAILFTSIHSFFIILLITQKQI